MGNLIKEAIIRGESGAAKRGLTFEAKFGAIVEMLFKPACIVRILGAGRTRWAISFPITPYTGVHRAWAEELHHAPSAL